MYVVFNILALRGMRLTQTAAASPGVSDFLPSPLQADKCTLADLKDAAAPGKAYVPGVIVHLEFHDGRLEDNVQRTNVPVEWLDLWMPHSEAVVLYFGDVRLRAAGKSEILAGQYFEARNSAHRQEQCRGRYHI